jgi:hypothetical protein
MRASGLQPHPRRSQTLQALVQGFLRLVQGATGDDHLYNIFLCIEFQLRGASRRSRTSDANLEGAGDDGIQIRWVILFPVVFATVHWVRQIHANID